MGRLGLGLGSGPHVVGRLGSGVSVSASFNSRGGEGNCPAEEMSRGE